MNLRQLCHAASSPLVLGQSNQGYPFAVRHRSGNVLNYTTLIAFKYPLQIPPIIIK